MAYWQFLVTKFRVQPRSVQSTRLSYQHIFDRDPKNGVTCPTVASAYKSSRKPLKTGCTLPAADLADIRFGKKLRLNPDAAMRNLFA
jgi:hypothetical protein